jgi:hypothetical protein
MVIFCVVTLPSRSTPAGAGCGCLPRRLMQTTTTHGGEEGPHGRRSHVSRSRVTAILQLLLLHLAGAPLAVRDRDVP